MEQNKILPLYEYVVDEQKLESGEAGLLAVSLVDEPAIQLDFLKFKDEQKKALKFQTQSEEQRIVTGIAMVAGQRIYRNDSIMGEYYAFFSAKTIRTLVENFFKKGNITSSFNINHQPIFPEGVYLIESWFTTASGKEKELGFNVPVGSWGTTLKIENQDVWDEYIKSGELKGFSIEVMCDAVLAFAKVCPITKEMTQISQLKKHIIEYEIDKMKFDNETTVEYWNKKCNCTNCKTLKSLGFVLPGILPDMPEHKRIHKIV